MVIHGVKDFPVEKEFDNPTVEVIDKALNAVENSINSIREELYGQGHIQSEITEIIKRLGEKHKDQNAGAALEETLAAIKRKIRQPDEVTPNEPQPVRSILELKTNKELIDDAFRIFRNELQSFFDDDKDE